MKYRAIFIRLSICKEVEVRFPHLFNNDTVYNPLTRSHTVGEDLMVTYLLPVGTLSKEDVTIFSLTYPKDKFFISETVFNDYPTD